MTQEPIKQIVVTGVDAELGAKVVAELAKQLPSTRLATKLVAVARKVPLHLPKEVAFERVDLRTADLEQLFQGASVVVHLSSLSNPNQPSPSNEELASDVHIAARVLQASASCWVSQVVMLSTALVYGAAATNPIPLTEDAPLAPNQEFSWAVARAEIEKIVASQRSNHPETKVAILRPAAVVADDALGQLARVLHSARLGVAADGDPPVQYLHINDLVSAVVLVVINQVEGAFNVAADGWIPPDGLRDLEGAKPRLWVPLWLAKLLARLRLRAGLVPVPVGVLPYTSHPWVIANDRLRALGWEPSYTNEQAWVVSHKPGPVDWVPVGRRQELALGLATLLVGTIMGLIGWMLRRFFCRSPSD